MNCEKNGKKTTAGVAILMVLLAGLIPMVLMGGSADADPAADLTVYRYTPKLTVTTEDPASVEYIVWDFGDGTVLDGRWEYYVQQQAAGEELSAEIIDGIEAYQNLLAQNGNSLWVTTHTYAATGTYTATVVAINALGYVSPVNSMPYDGVFSTDETGFDGGMNDSASADITAPTDGDLESSAFKGVAGTWCRVLYTVDVLGYPTISFESNGGTAVDPLVVENGSEYSAATAPAAPTKDDSTFAGWFTDPACTQEYDWSRLVTAPMTLYAGWIPDSVPIYGHILTFMDGSEVLGNQNLVNEVNGTVSIAISQADPVREGFSFLGWSTSTDATAADYHMGDTVSVPVTGTTLYAVWQVSGSTVSVTIDGHAAVIESGKTVGSLTAPAVEGYVFAGWYSDEARTQALSAGTVITEGMTLYTKYNPVDTADETGNKDSEIPVWNILVILIGAAVAVIGLRYHPYILIAGIAVAVVGVIDFFGFVEIF